MQISKLESHARGDMVKSRGELRGDSTGSRQGPNVIFRLRSRREGVEEEAEYAWYGNEYASLSGRCWRRWHSRQACMLTGEERRGIRTNRSGSRGSEIESKRGQPPWNEGGRQKVAEAADVCRRRGTSRFLPLGLLQS
jgi:hypothetical protein